MEENISSPAEINSISYLNKKRKLQTGLLEMPLPKHVCWTQKLEYDSDLTVEPKKVASSIFARGGELGPESASISYSFPSFMSSHDDAKTYLLYPNTHESIEPSTSPTCLDGVSSSQIDPYSSQSRLQAKSSSSKPGSPSICEELRHLDHEYGLHTSDDYNDQLLDFEHCMDKDLDDLLYSNGVANGDYVLSSGRWSVNQDSREGTKKLTIDKEFEQYFSTLML